MKKVISILTTMLLLCFPAYSQDESLTDSQTEQKSKEIEIYFDLNSCVVDSAYHRNSESLSNLVNLITQLQQDSLTTISKIEISSYASPDGGKQYNETITEQRTNAITDYLREATSVPDSIIIINNIGVDWEGLNQLVEVSTTMEYKDEVLHILNTVPEETWNRVNPSDRWLTLTDSLNRQLMDLKSGRPYRYMIKELFPQLRRSSIATIYICKEVEEEIETIEPQNTIQLSQEQESEDIASIPTYTEQIEAVEPTAVEQDSRERKPLFAIKTNLLYDIALTPNLKIEVPIGERWSVGAQAMCGWWSKSDNSFAWQIQAADLEARYWFGDRTDKRVMSGWFAGAFTSAGLYDVQLKSTNGIQGEIFVLAGLSGGYSLPLGDSFYMEFAAGVGYIINDYQKYIVADGKYLIADENKMRFQSIFPAKVEVSLGWLLFNKKGGRK